MATELGTAILSETDYKTDQDVMVSIKRTVKYRAQIILYERTVAVGSLAIEVWLKYGGREYLVRRVANFTNNYWAFQPEIDFPPRIELIVKTVGAVAGEDHSLLVLVAE